MMIKMIPKVPRTCVRWYGTEKQHALEHCPGRPCRERPHQDREPEAPRRFRDRQTHVAAERDEGAVRHVDVAHEAKN